MGSAKEVIRGRGMIPGRRAGKALVSRQPFMFAHGVDPKTGDVIDVRSDILGRNIKGTVLIFPFGKGSTTGSAWFLETIRQGNGPSAVINVQADVIVVSAVVLAQLLYGTAIPLVDQLEKNITDLVTEDTLLDVDGTMGVVRIVS